jgi:hypothetical protein
MTPHEVTSLHEEHARALKVERLTNYLSIYICGSATDQNNQIEALQTMDQKWWKGVATHCTNEIGHKVNPPSAESVRHIQAELRKRIPTDDVFDKLDRSYRADRDAEARGIGGTFS